MDTIHAVGRRKHSVTRVYLKSGKGKIAINNKDYKEYFPTLLLQYKLEQSQNLVSSCKDFDVKVNVFGGGLTGQAEAIRLAISRALCELDIENRSALKPAGLLTRDAREVERKKPGQKKARKKFQWVKR